MVYKRYITKRGKKLGPYYYDNIKGKDGKIKTVYLGKTMPKDFSEKLEEKPSSPNSLYKEKIDKLNNNIALCESRKEKLKSKIAELQRRYEKGEINYSRYELLLNHILQRKSLAYWYKYYDDYKIKVNAQIKKYESESLPLEEEKQPEKEEKIEEIVTKISTEVSKKVLDDYIKEKELKPKKTLSDILTLETPTSKVIMLILLALILIPTFSFFKTTLVDKPLEERFILEERKEVEGEEIVGGQIFDKIMFSGKDIQQQKPKEIYEKEVVEEEQEPSFIAKIISFFSEPSVTGQAVIQAGPAAPAFTAFGAPADSPDPQNQGSNVVFTANADDANTDAWWLIVCKTGTPTGVKAGAPSCNDAGAELCVSTSSAASGSNNSCTWDTTGNSSTTWTGFACDGSNQFLCNAGDSTNSGTTINVPNTAPSFSNPKLSSTNAGSETDPSYHNETLNMSVDVTETNADGLQIWFTAWGGNESETTPAVNVTFGDAGGVECTNSSATSWNGVTCEIKSPAIDVYSIATGNFTGKWYAFDGTAAMIDTTEDTIMTDAAPVWFEALADRSTNEDNDLDVDPDMSTTDTYGNCTDIDANETASFSIQSQSGVGTFSVSGTNNVNLSFSPNANATGTADVTVRCGITNGLYTDDDATVTVNAVNDPPWWNETANNTYSYSEDSGNFNVWDEDGLNNTFWDVETADNHLPYNCTASANDTYIVTNITYNDAGINANSVSNVSGAFTLTVNCSDSGWLSSLTSFDIVVNAVNDPPWWDEISNNSADPNGPSDITQDAGWQPLGKSGNDFNASEYWWDVEDGQALGIGTGNLTIETNDSAKVLCALGENLGSGAGFDGNWSILCNPIEAGFTGDFIVTLNGSDSNSPPSWEMTSFEGYVASANAAPSAPVIALNFTLDNVNYTNESMWCEIYYDDPDGNAGSLDVLLINSTSNDINTAELQWRLDDAFTSITDETYVQIEILEQNFTKDDFVWCQAVANDGVTGDSSYTNSTILDVENYPVKISDPLGSWSIDEDFDNFTLDWTNNLTDPDFDEGKDIFLNWTFYMNDTEVLGINSLDNATDVITIGRLDNVSGSVLIDFNISDSSGLGEFFNETVTWTVNAVNDAPWWDYITNNSISINEDGGFQLVVNVSTYFRDVEDNATPQNLMEPLTNETAVSCSYTLDELYCSSESHNGPFIVNITMQDSGGISNAIQQDFEVTVNAVNDVPVLENVTYQSGLGANGALNAGVPTNLYFSLLLMDFDGDDDVDNSSIMLNVTLDGGETRINDTRGTDPSCYPETAGSNATRQNYTCTIIMQHWDLGGDWTCTSTGGDGTANSSYREVSNCFTIGSTLSLNMTSTNITWSSLAVGATNTLMDTAELNITNDGNQNISNITLKAWDLPGKTTPGDVIEANNFTATWGVRSCDYGQWLINGTNLQILANGTANNPLNFAEPTNSMTNNATHICLEHVGEGLSQQDYSATENTLASERYWQITGGTAEI